MPAADRLDLLRSSRVPRGTPGQLRRRALRGRRWRRALMGRRRLLACGLIAAAVAAGVHALRPVPAPTVAVVVAASDLAAGHVLGQADLRPAAWPAGAVPAGAANAPQGRVLAAPVRAGEPITDVRLTGPGLLRGQPNGTRAVPVRLADPAVARLLRPGDRVDVLAGAATGVPDQPDGQVVASDALVISVPGPVGGDPADLLAGAPGAGAAGAEDAGLVVLAVDEPSARRITAQAGVRALSVAVRGPDR